MLKVNEFHDISARSERDPQHRAMSREPKSHNAAIVVLALACVTGVFGVLYILYVFG